MNNERMYKTIKGEIEILNRKIDLKIIRGTSYKQEARRHKFLVSQLRTMNKQETPHWLSKMSSAVASFML
jgi:hypothetical protein